MWAPCTRTPTTGARHLQASEARSGRRNEQTKTKAEYVKQGMIRLFVPINACMWNSYNNGTGQSLAVRRARQQYNSSQTAAAATAKTTRREYGRIQCRLNSTHTGHLFTFCSWKMHTIKNVSKIKRNIDLFTFGLFKVGDYEGSVHIAHAAQPRVCRPQFAFPV